MTKRQIVSDVKARLRRTFQREDGQVIIMVGLATIVLFGVIGLAVDVGRMYIMKAELSRAMDAAALAGVLEPPDAAKAKAACEEYLLKNEPDILPIGGSELCTSPGENTLQVRGRKEMTMFFIRVLGIDDAAVTGRAKAGFGVAFLDAALVIDATSSMADPPCTSGSDNTTSGCPIKEAKAAAKAFKDVLLGPSPDGNTVIGLNAFRGCYRDDNTSGNSNNALAPMSNTQTNCVPDHGSASTSQVIGLQSNAATLNTKIDAISAIGGSGTNVCNGMLKAWEVLNGPGNHLAQANNLRYMIVLSDGDNNYNGSYSYQSTPYASPHTYNGYSCQPPSSCSNVGGDSSSTPLCHSGVQTSLTTEASDNFGSTTAASITENFPNGATPANCTGYAWNTGSGWAPGAWTLSPTSGTDKPITVTTPAQGLSCAAQLQGVSSITRPVNFSSVTSAGMTYYARRGSSTWESGSDFAYAEAATSLAGPWTTLVTHSSTITTTYTSFGNSTNLNSFAGQPTVYIRFRTQTTTGQTEYFYVDTINISTTSTCPGWNNTTLGTWGGAWTISPSSGNDMPQTPTTGTPFDTTCHAMLRGVGTITRTVDLTGVGTGTLTYYAKRTNWEGSETVLVQASSNGSTWTTLRTIDTSNLSNNTYTQFTEDLYAFAGANTYIRFAGNMTADATDDQLYIDKVLVQSGASSSAGYLNGQDSSPSCSGTAAKRERQLDMLSWDLAKALELDGVEIYVVSFGACSANATTYTQAQCDAQIGNTDNDNTADQRLAKCISSSKPNTNDHWFYASSASGLPAIFTQIAKQIAHRLIE